MAWQTTCPYLRTPMVRHKMGVCICHRNRLWFYPVPLGGSPRGTLAPVFLRFSFIVCLSGWTYLGFLLGNVLSSIGSRKRDYHTARCPVWCSPFQSIFQETGDSSWGWAQLKSVKISIIPDGRIFPLPYCCWSWSLWRSSHISLQSFLRSWI